MSDVDKKAWALMVAEVGDAVHENPDLAEALLPKYREQAKAEDHQ